MRSRRRYRTAHDGKAPFARLFKAAIEASCEAPESPDQRDPVRIGFITVRVHFHVRYRLQQRE
jgi:hypothetical protein